MSDIHHLAIFNGVALDKECEQCHGKGWWVHHDGTHIGCGTCDRNGVLLTEEGKALRDFILRYVSVRDIC